jgi:peptide/nickel transport system substrate-binding protein
MDEEVTPLMGAAQATYGVGTTLTVVDDYTFQFNVQTPFASALLYSMAYGNFCPGPSHMLAPTTPPRVAKAMKVSATPFRPIT